MAYFEGLPRLNQLHEIATRAAAKFDSWPGGVFYCLELLETLENDGFFPTPVNSSTFARTGGDGVHFSLVHINGIADDDSPVVMISPFGTHFNVIVGSNLTEFLQLGCMGTFCQLEACGLGLDRYLLRIAAIQQGNYQVLGGDVEDTRQEVERLEFLRKELSLDPIPNIEQHLRSLKEQFYPLLEFSSNDYLQSDQ